MSSSFDSHAAFSRRRALVLGGSVSGGLIVAGSSAAFGGVVPLGAGLHVRGDTPALRIDDRLAGADLPVHEIEEIFQIQGNVSSSGVLSIEIDRTDLQVTRNGIPWLPSFEVNGTVYFQSLGGKAILNGDVALLAKETNPFIDALLKNGLVFQAFHQHFFDLTPQIWHIHFRGVGDPLGLAEALVTAIKTATSTPFPQSSPTQTTPLPAGQLARILGGTATIGDNGVVSVSVPRADRIILGGIPIAGDEGVGLTVAFEPLANGQTVGAPDFSMTASEVLPVTTVMRRQGWENNCLYNQETDEMPQLYFSHQVKIGNSVQLAEEIRNGANRTDLKFSS